MPDIHIVEPAQVVDGWVVTSTGRDATVLLTDDIVAHYVRIDDAASV